MKTRPYLFLTTLVALSGCTPAIDAELRLIEQSRRGVGLVRRSLEQRRDIDAAMRESERRRLDDAFDADLATHADEVSPQWVLEARRAYATAAEALARREQAGVRAIEIDLQNLDAVSAALDELERLNRVQRDLVLPPEQP